MGSYSSDAHLYLSSVWKKEGRCRFYKIFKLLNQHTFFRTKVWALCPVPKKNWEIRICFIALKKKNPSTGPICRVQKFSYISFDVFQITVKVRNHTLWYLDREFLDLEITKKWESRMCFSWWKPVHATECAIALHISLWWNPDLY